MELHTEKETSPFSEGSIERIVQELQEECKLDMHLPGGGYLHMSDELPYLVIYRLPASEEEGKEDKSTVRFVLSEASFLIIGNQDFEGYRRLMLCLGDAMASKFKSFLLLEVYAGEIGSDRFTVRGPAVKLPATLKELKKELDFLTEKYKGLYFSRTLVEDTQERQLQGQKALLEVDALKDSGCLLLGLEVPPVYRNRHGEEYPVFFRSFKDNFIRALHKAIFQFIRVQTNSGVSSYYALGQQTIKEKALKIDLQLARIETSYQFLWLISPSNIKNVKDTFFNSGYKELLNYHYRLLPIDPDVLKRELYNLKLEDIDDPALSFLFREKREELELQISMLNDRGTRHFFYNSLMLYNGIEDKLIEEAKQLLLDVDEEEPTEAAELLDANEFKELAEKEFEYFRGQDENFHSKIHIRDDVNILMVSQGELYIPADYQMDAASTLALIQHEVGTHILTYYNGLQQPLKQLSTGLTDYDTLQEGLAVLAEYLVGGLSANRMRTLAGRVVAASARVEGKDFREIFDLLHRQHGFSALRAFNITSRIMQGSGFIKDIIYLQGIVELKDYLEKDGELEPLLIGKFALKHLPVINELMERKVLKKHSILPRYLNTKETNERLNKIRNGLSLSQMISA